MENKLEFIQDTLGSDYLVIKFSKKDDIIIHYLNILKKYLGDELYDLYTANQIDRDKGGYHITVINVPEINKLSKNINEYDRLFNFENYLIDDLQYKGLGSVKNDKSITYYVVVKSDKINTIRGSLGLPKRDLHITLAFSLTDVFGLPKDETSLIDVNNGFIKKIKSDYNISENLDFIKQIKTYNFDKDLDIKAYQIDINTGIFYIRESKQVFSIILDDDGEYLINASWHSEKELPTIPRNVLTKLIN